MIVGAAGTSRCDVRTPGRGIRANVPAAGKWGDME